MIEELYEKHIKPIDDEVIAYINTPGNVVHYPLISPGVHVSSTSSSAVMDITINIWWTIVANELVRKCFRGYFLPILEEQEAIRMLLGVNNPRAIITVKKAKHSVFGLFPKNKRFEAAIEYMQFVQRQKFKDIFPNHYRTDDFE